jgi:hypothetical protein
MRAGVGDEEEEGLGWRCVVVVVHVLQSGVDYLVFDISVFREDVACSGDVSCVRGT